MTSFDVWTEPWVPLRFQDGSRREVGLGEALVSAHLATEIDEPVPTLAFGLYRLLVALTMDLHRFEDREELLDALELTSFDPTVIGKYHREHSDRFDLFHPKRPFLQTAASAEEQKKRSAVAGLLQHVPSGTGATHFAHGLAENHAWSPAVCARALTAVAPFMTAGGAGYSPSINGAPPWYVLPKGKTLRETLLYNCWAEQGTPPYTGLGLPAWRQAAPITPKEERKRYSLMEGLTWQPRLICLIPGEAGTCTYTGEACPQLVREMVFTFGLKTGDPDNWQDPNVAYTFDEKKGRSKVMPREGYQAWRNLAVFALAQQSNTEAKRPMVMQQLRQLSQDRSELRRMELECYGMRTDNMKIFEWHCETLKIDANVFTLPNGYSEVQRAISTVERYDKLLRNCINKAYKKYLPAPSQLLWEEVRVPFLKQFLPLLGQTTEGDLRAVDTLQNDWEGIVERQTSGVLESYLSRLGQRPEAQILAADIRKYYRGTLRKWSGASDNKKGAPTK